MTFRIVTLKILVVDRVSNNSNTSRVATYMFVAPLEACCNHCMAPSFNGDRKLNSNSTHPAHTPQPSSFPIQYSPLSLPMPGFAPSRRCQVLWESAGSSLTDMARKYSRYSRWPMTLSTNTQRGHERIKKKQRGQQRVVPARQHQRHSLDHPFSM